MVAEFMSILNLILLDWKDGDIHGLDWLRSRKMGQRLAYSCYESGYLEKIGPGVFAKKNNLVDGLAVVRFLQEELKLKLHISGRTALELHGHIHYLALGGKRRIYLRSYESKAFPTWLKKINDTHEFEFRKSSLFLREDFLAIHNINGFEVKIASRELAILELIDMLDLSSGLETVENYVQSLMTLRAEVLQKVLEACKSVKVKRVFLFLSEKLNLPSFTKLQLNRIDIGSGKRVIVKGGELNKKYLITVDRHYGENPF